MQDRYSKLIILVFLLVQVAIIFIFGYTPYPDSEGYIAAASEALRQGSPYPSPEQLHNLEFIWNVGSINAVELSLWLSQSVLPSVPLLTEEGSGVVLLMIVYAIMKGLTAAMLFSITETLSDKRTAFIALVIYVCYPANYGEATSTLSEVPFIFFIMLSLWLVFVKKRPLLGGAVMALANWFRPMGLVFLVAIAIISILKRQRSLLRTAGGYIAMLLIIGTATRLYTGRFFFQAQTGWMALMQYSWDNDTQQAPDTCLFYRGDPMAIPDGSATDGVERNRYWQKNFSRWIAGGNIVEYLRQMPRKVLDTYVSDNVNMCTFIPDKAERQYMYGEVSMPTLAASFPRLTPVQWLTTLNLLFYYLLLLLYIVSLLTLRPSFRSSNGGAYIHVLTLAIVAAGTLLLVFFGHGEARFHQPFMPFIIMAVAALIAEKTLGKSKRQP